MSMVRSLLEEAHHLVSHFLAVRTTGPVGSKYEIRVLHSFATINLIKGDSRKGSETYEMRLAGLQWTRAPFFRGLASIRPRNQNLQLGVPEQPTRIPQDSILTYGRCECIWYLMEEVDVGG